jgi:hypothetical protein
MSDETHPMFSPEVRQAWAKQGMQIYGDETPGRSAQFYHATRKNLDNETHVQTPAALGHTSRTGSVDDTNWFATADPSRMRRNYGGNVYRVEPTGPFTDNFDATGELGGEYATQHPLRILSKVQFNAGGS